ncbi:cell surface protein [Xylophilus ampelinus]|uniref:Cell surface protein n=1 Tax=Xylophilus ampelinus TaxID=54067 RepID=A0A318SEG6_9BURK|nr:cell surface protein [Xylophilus ampelinus]MCS4510980.1 cell surface protein [Xylophilus ampelinus]PYE76027.1 hypothetical protein DFQ15_11760 [Xylophilus ampelinus]
MKKSLLSLSIGAAVAGLTLAGAANAAVSQQGTGAAAGTTAAGTLHATTTGATLELNAGGIGHIGLIPYFSTQAGNQTLFSITNTDTVNGKAVKVRFRSAANSDDIFDFTLFLSPGDVWTANISRDVATGGSRLVTNDNSCTLPATAVLNRGFVTDRLPASFTAAQKAEWTSEGYVEVLTMADIPPVYTDGAARPNAAGTLNNSTNALYTTIKHVNGVAPCDATQLATVLTDKPTEADLVAAGFDTPTSGLYTNAFIINTANALMSWSNESTAVQAVTVAGGVTTAARGRVVFAPQTNDAVTQTINQLTADPLLAGGLSSTGVAVPAPIQALQFDFPDLSTPYVDVNALSATGAGSPAAQSSRLSGSLAATSIKNDYSTLAAIGSKTDFTFSLPTRRYHAAVNYATTPFTPVYTTPAAGFASYFTAANTSLLGSLLCVNPGSAPLSVFDRSERTLTTSNGAVVSPGAATAGLRFCGEVSVLTINNDPSAPAGKGVLGATVAVQNVFTGFQEGWINIATPGIANAGLPALGSAYTSAVGSPANGVSTNYSWAFKHKATFP